MTNLQVNIGMNNNTMTNEQLVDYIEQLNGYDLHGYYFVDKTFMGEVEPTFVGWLKTRYARPSKVLGDFELVASVLGQQCIAISMPSLEALAFSPSADDKGYRFDPSLFEYLIKRKN